MTSINDLVAELRNEAAARAKQPRNLRRATDADWDNNHDPCQGRCCRGGVDPLAQPGDLYGGRND